jgi:hypothetical protein
VPLPLSERVEQLLALVVERSEGEKREKSSAPWGELAERGRELGHTLREKDGADWLSTGWEE